MNRLHGFSTGCVHRWGLSLEETLELFISLELSAVELNLSHGRLEKLEVTTKLRELTKKFSFVTIHAPTPTNASCKKVCDQLRRVTSHLPIDHVTVHPDKLTDFSRLHNDIPFSVENMDKDKSGWQRPEAFTQLRASTDFGFVLDAQHAYEEDPDMQVFDGFLAFFADRLTHLHISGEQAGNNHELVSTARNKQAILEAMNRTSQPVILEGVAPKSRNVLEQELALIREYL